MSQFENVQKIILYMIMIDSGIFIIRPLSGRARFGQITEMVTLSKWFKQNRMAKKWSFPPGGQIVKVVLFQGSTVHKNAFIRDKHESTVVIEHHDLSSSK